MSWVIDTSRSEAEKRAWKEAEQFADVLLKCAKDIKQYLKKGHGDPGGFAAAQYAMRYWRAQTEAIARRDENRRISYENTRKNKNEPACKH